MDIFTGVDQIRAIKNITAGTANGPVFKIKMLDAARLTIESSRILMVMIIIERIPFSIFI